MNVKKIYFEKRVQELSEADSQRYEWGERDCLTMEAIFRINFKQQIPSLSQLNILDLGAGDRFIEQPLLARLNTYEPIDIDSVNFEYDDLPYPDHHFDLVVSLAVIEHISNPEHILSELRRVLKPGGIVYLTTPNFKYCSTTFYDDPTHVKPYTEVSLAKTLDYAGFSDIGVYPGLRCKPDTYYTRKNAFKKAAQIPFVGNPWYIPPFLRGKATSVIAVARA